MCIRDRYQWMHYQIDTNPSKVKVSKHSWQRPHSDNKTGTEKAYRPHKITNKNKDFKKAFPSNKMQEARKAYTLLIRFVFNLKRLLSKVGVRGPIGSAAAAAIAFLKEEYPNTLYVEQEVNKYLKFDRSKALGFRLNIPAGTAVRFEPGMIRKIEVVALSGKREVYGFNGNVNGLLPK